MGARPLEGRRVLVTRAAPKARELEERLEALGAETLRLPGLEPGPPADFGPLDAALRRAAEFDFLTVTSQNAVAPLVLRARLAGISLGRLRVAAVGGATARALEAEGLPPAIVPVRPDALGLVAALAPELRGRRVLWPRAERASEEFAPALREAGALEVAAVAAYRMSVPGGVDPAPARRALASGAVDAVLFGSGRTVEGVLELLGPEGPSALRQARLVCLGKGAAEACERLELGKPWLAAQPMLEAWVEALLLSLAGPPHEPDEPSGAREARASSRPRSSRPRRRRSTR